MPGPTGTRQSSTSDSNQNLAGCHVCNLLLTPPSHKRTKVKNKVPKASSRSIRQLMSLETTSLFNMVTWMFLCFRSCFKKNTVTKVGREPGPNHGVMGVQNDRLSSFFRLFMGSEHSAARCDRNCRTSGALESYVGGLGGLKLAVLQSSGLLNSI